jgi:hypothetical protein
MPLPMLFPPLTVLLLTVISMIGEIVSFSMVLSVVFFAFGLSKYVAPHVSSGRHTVLNSVAAEFWHTVGGGDDSTDEPLFFHLLCSFFSTVLVVMILMKVLETMMMDMYAKQKERARAQWCVRQLEMLREIEDFVHVTWRHKLKGARAKAKDWLQCKWIAHGRSPVRIAAAVLRVGARCLSWLLRLTLIAAVIWVKIICRQLRVLQLRVCGAARPTRLDKMKTFEKVRRALRWNPKKKEEEKRVVEQKLKSYHQKIASKMDEALSACRRAQSSTAVASAAHPIRELARSVLQVRAVAAGGGMGGPEDFVMKEKEFEKQLTAHTFAELAFFVGEVKGPDGTNNETAANEIASKTRDTMKAFFRILHRDPSFFIDCKQKRDDCIREIAEAHDLVKETLKINDADGVAGFLALLAITSLGRVSNFATDLGVDQISHDAVVLEALKSKKEHFLPSYYAVSDKYRRYILEGFETRVNFGQFGQLEAPPQSLNKLAVLFKTQQRINADPSSSMPSEWLDGEWLDGRCAAQIFLFHQLLLISGNSQGRMPLALWRALLDDFHTLGKLASQTPAEVFKQSVDDVATRLVDRAVTLLHESVTSSHPLECFGKLQPQRLTNYADEDTRRALARLAKMLRLQVPPSADDQGALVLIVAFQRLTKSRRKYLVDGLAAQPILLMYAPNILQNLVEYSSADGKKVNAGKGIVKFSKEAIDKLKCGLDLLSILFEKATKILREMGETDPAFVYHVGCYSISLIKEVEKLDAIIAGDHERVELFHDPETREARAFKVAAQSMAASSPSSHSRRPY